MSIQDIIRAWKDANYRQSLSEEEQALLPEHPAGAIELHASELETVNGAANPETAPADLGVFFGTTFPICPLR